MLRLAALLLLVVVVVGGVLAGRSALLAAGELEQARAALTEARSSDASTPESLVPVLDRAQRLVDRADRRLSSIPVAALARVPVLGRSFAAERAAASAAASALAGVRLVADAGPALRTSDGLDVQGLRRLGEQLAPFASEAARDLTALRAVDTGLTPARVGEGVAAADRALAPVVEGLRSGASGADLAAGLLGADGPRDVLVVLGNNAELRGTGGYVSTFATGTTRDGALQLDPFRDVLEVHDPVGSTRRVPAPPEYREDFGEFLADTTLWREWTMSPDFPDAASVTAEVADVLVGTRPDLVLFLDVPALTSLVGLAGQQVRLPDGTVVAADGLTEALLTDTYAAAGEDPVAQDARRAVLRAAAGRTAAQLLDSDVAPLDLVRELGGLAAGRHLAVWSADAGEQAELERLGVAGSADPGEDDSTLVSVNNLNANKLDYYVSRTVDVQVTVGRERAEVVQRVELRNRAPDGLVEYVAGDVLPGTAVERVEFSIAQDAEFRSLRRDGQRTRGDVRQGEERTRVHTYVELARGSAVEVELRYAVPVEQGRYRLRLLPQPLATDAELRVEVSPGRGLVLRELAGAERLQDGTALRTGPWAERELLDVTVGADG